MYVLCVCEWACDKVMDIIYYTPLSTVILRDTLEKLKAILAVTDCTKVAIQNSQIVFFQVITNC